MPRVKDKQLSKFLGKESSEHKNRSNFSKAVHVFFSSNKCYKYTSN